jgi:shikimate kinase
MTSRAEILLLVGPKGAGKTTIGRILEREAGAYFLEVELIAKRVLDATGGVISENYARQAFGAIAAEVLAISKGRRVVVIETTGASAETAGFIATLRKDHVVRLVRVHSSAETCAKRIAERDSSRQVDVPVELIREMHERTESLDLEWDLELKNDPPLSAEEVLQAIDPLLLHRPWGSRRRR